VRRLILVFLPLSALFLQTNLFGALAWQGTIPDILLIVVVFFAIFNGANQGTIYGICCGLLEDLYLGRFIGLNAVSKGITAYIIGRLQGNVFKENILVGVIGVGGATLVNSFIVFILSLSSFGSSQTIKFMVISILWELVYNTIITIPLYGWYYRSSQRGVLKEKGNRI
jgi:rod shape-determining protein MreD